jgi:hypothetical protein
VGAYANILGFFDEEDRRKLSESQLRSVLQEEEAIYSASPIGLLRLNEQMQIRANRMAKTFLAAGKQPARHAPDGAAGIRPKLVRPDQPAQQYGAVPEQAALRTGVH